MSTTDTLVTIGVLIGVFILAYSAVRHKDLLDVVGELKEIIQGKAEDIAGGITPYA
jgi:hypothetical protein